MERTFDRQNAHVVAAGIVSGVIGGVLIDGFLSVANHMSLIAIWQFVASGLIGSVAFTSSSYAELGFVLHFVISIVWGLIFAWGALSMPVLVRRPVLSGLLCGVVVMAAMSALVMFKHLGPAPDPAAIVKSLIAHTVFFGLPVSLFVNKGIRA